jgi:hypothetical protein
MVFKLSSNDFSMEFKLKTNGFSMDIKLKKKGFSMEFHLKKNPRRPSPQGKLLSFFFFLNI